MRITKKMLEKATADIPMNLANELATRRWKPESLPFINGIKNAIKNGEKFHEAQLRAYASREQGDAINLSLYIWIAKAVSRISPELVDQNSLAALEKETAERGWLLG